MLNTSAKFHKLPARIMRIWLFSEIQFFTMTINLEVTKPKVFKGWVIIDNSVYLLLKKLREITLRIWRRRNLKFLKVMRIKVLQQVEIVTHGPIFKLYEKYSKSPNRLKIRREI